MTERGDITTVFRERAKALHTGSLHLDRALSVIDERLGDPTLSLLNLSHAVGVSEGHLGRLFRKTGLTFRQYLRELRIRKAAALLLRSADEVKCIAIDVGYRSQAYFGREFRECVGLTPQRFRTLMKGPPPPNNSTRACNTSDFL